MSRRRRIAVATAANHPSGSDTPVNHRAAGDSWTGDPPLGDRLRPLWLAGFAALCVTAPVLPSETVLLGSGMMVWMLFWWALLLAWLLAGSARGGIELRLGPAVWAGAAFLVWHSTSAVVMAWRGHPRASWNMLWLWLTLGAAFFLARQLIRTAAERRAVCSAMIALAVSFSVLGYYQYAYDFPATREQYQRDPEAVMRNAGVPAEMGTPQQKLFEARLFSTEPTATFALTNSLAGFLAPWWIVVLGIVMNDAGFATAGGTGDRRWVRIVGVVAVLLIFGCLVLTKSRSAWLATLGGMLLLAIYGRRTGWRPDWRLFAGIGLASAVLPFLAVVVGGLDWLVLLESSKSFLYRIQYWRATAAMVGDHPWFGCGPGNFQQYYTAYKLPEASETIAEPHNFLLEIWATAGTPAFALFLSLFGGMIWQAWRGQAWRAESASAAVADDLTKGAPQLSQRAEIGAVGAVYCGLLVGVLLGTLLCGFLEGYLPSVGWLLLGVPVGAGVVAILHRWVVGGRLSPAVLAIAIVVLLVHLLAAGGIGFAAVSLSLWLLLAILLHEVEQPESSQRGFVHRLGRWPTVGLTAVVALLFFAFHQSEYSPVMHGTARLNEGHSRRVVGQLQPAFAAYREAAEADPLSPDPWEYLAGLASEGWRQSGDAALAEEFRRATGESLLRNSHSSPAYMTAGHRWLAAYRRFGRREFLVHAVECYRIAVELYPNYNLGQAQLAWALHLASDTTADVAAAEALRLDALTPHQEQKLARQRLFDLSPTAAGQPADPGDRSAEQTLRGLRSSSRPGSAVTFENR